MRALNTQMRMFAASIIALALGVFALVPMNSAVAANTEVMNNGTTTNNTATTTTDGTNTFVHTLYFTAQGSDGNTYTSNLSSTNPAVDDSVLNLDKITKDSDGSYHFNAVVELTPTNAVSNLNFILTAPSSTSKSSGAPNVQLSGAPVFSGTDAANVQAASRYSNVAAPGKYYGESQYNTTFGNPMPNIYYINLRGKLTAGQKLTVTFPYVLKNADSFDFAQATSSVTFSESIGNNLGITPWGVYTSTDLTMTRLRFGKTDSAPVSNLWALYNPLKSDYDGKSTNSVRYLFTKNNNISRGTSLNYTYTNVPQISNDIVGLNASDFEYKNSTSANYEPLTTMFANSTPAYNRGGYFRLKLDKIKKAYDGTGWSTNGFYTNYYTYTSDASGNLVIHGLNDNGGSLPSASINVELWQYLAASENLRLTVGDTFDPAQALEWVRPYNATEVRNPLSDATQSKLIDVTYTDAQGNTVNSVDTSKPGVYTVTYRYWLADSNGNRTTDSASVRTTVYVTAQKAADDKGNDTKPQPQPTKPAQGSKKKASLAKTGVDVATMSWVATLLIVAGAGMIAYRRRNHA